MIRKHSGVVAMVGLAAVICSAGPALAQSLGAASSFAVVAGAGVTAAGGAGTAVTGDVGTSPTASITGFPPAIVVAPFGLHPNDAAAIAAQAAAGTLFSSLNTGSCADTPTPQMSGAVFLPGIHCFTSTADLAAGASMTLSGAGIFIFRVPTALTLNVGASMVLAGADPCSVFWQVGTAATLNSINAVGNVDAQAGVTLGVGDALTGRAMSTVGPVTLSGNNSAGGCSSTPAPPVCPTIALSPSTLPGGTVGVAFAQTILGSGGTAPYTFSVTVGTLPAGLTLTATGVLSGTPTVAGSSPVTIRGTDANGCFQSVAFTLVIAAAPVPPPVCPTITVLPTALPGGIVGLPFTQTITASGGTAPFSFGVTSGTLPAGITLTSTGVLAGTPTATGSSPITIRATDAVGCFQALPLTLVIAAAPVCPVITLSPTILPPAIVGLPFSQAIVPSAGAAPFTFAVTVGTLPAGLTLNAAGVIVGVPTTAGTTPITIRATDANGCAQTIALNVVVSLPVPTMSEWAMILLTALLGCAGIVALRRRAI